jgi:hypothetical protein
VRNQGRIIVAAGELSKEGRTIKFNLESGTYTRNIMKITGNYVTESNYIRLVKNALRNSIPDKNYTTNILIPKIPASLQNLVNRGNLSFYFGSPTNKTKTRIMKELSKAGLNSNSAMNLIRKLKNSSPARASPQGRKRKVNNNDNAAGAPKVHGRR